MIMQCPDFDDDDTFELFPSSPDQSSINEFDSRSTTSAEPGMQYRGVPQDSARRTLRIDRASLTYLRIEAPNWQLSRSSSCDLNLTELFFG